MNKSFLTLAALAIGFLGAPVSANAFSLGGNINGEQNFSDLGATIDVAAEGRIGRIGDHELNFHYDNKNSPGQTVFTQSNFDSWQNGIGEDFTLTFENDILTYEIGGQTLTYNFEIDEKNTNIESPFDDLFIRTTARKAGSGIVIDNLKLNGEVVGETSSFFCSEENGCGYYNSSQYLWIKDLGESFTLAGRATMNWDSSNKPKNSQLAFQFKLGNAEDGNLGALASTPEPVSMSLLSVGVVGLGMAGLRRQKKA